MYDNLKSLGITNPDEIDRYSLRQEANNDILKIYFQKDKGEFFAKSVKFKYPRQRKTVVADGVGQGYKEVQEISPNLRYFFCLHVLALFVQLQRDIQQQPVVKATEIQAGQLRDTVQPVLQRIAMNKQRL